MPGSIPAAILLLSAAVLNGIANSIPGEHVRVSPLPGLVIGLGLLLGGVRFRTWGVFSCIAGLIVWPIVFSTGTFGTASSAHWFGLLFNVGVLLLLVGKPSPNRVWTGFTVGTVGILASLLIGFAEGVIADRATSWGIPPSPTVPPAAESITPSANPKAREMHSDPVNEVGVALRGWHARVRADDIEGDLAFWAPQVEYFTRGLVPRDHVRTDRARFYSAPYHTVDWGPPRITATDGRVEVVEDVEFATGPSRPSAPVASEARLARAPAANQGLLPKPYAARVQVRMVWVHGSSGWNIAGIREEKVYWRRRGALALASGDPSSDATADETAEATPAPSSDADTTEPTTPQADLTPVPRFGRGTGGGENHGGEIYTNVGDGHWIQEISGSGKIIELEDGSVWEIDGLDRIDTALWLGSDDILVADSSDPTHPYLLINKDQQGEKAHARLLKQ